MSVLPEEGGSPPAADSLAADAGPHARVWQHIRLGRAPSAEALAGIAGEDAVRLGSDGVAALSRDLQRDLLGAGPLDPLLSDPDVTDVLVNGVDGVWVDRGAGLREAEVSFRDVDAVRRLAVRLAALAGQRLDDASPWVDGLLPGGVRLHAILPPLVDGGAHLSLRVPRRVSPDLRTLEAWGMFDAEIGQILRGVIERRVSFVITGGTGSGKTTLLGAMLQEVGSAERIVLVEDTRELAARHAHLVRLQGKAANVEGRGEVTLAALVRQSLRMRPDRLVVGEVRGPEVREMLSALNTGHEGGASTLHANTLADVPTRFEALGALAGLAPEAVHAQLASAIQVVIHVQRHAGARRLAEIGTVQRVPTRGRAEVLPAWSSEGRVPGLGWTTLCSLTGHTGG